MNYDINKLIDEVKDDADSKKIMKILAKSSVHEWDPSVTFMLLYREIHGDTLTKEYCEWLVDHMKHGNEGGRKWTCDQTNELARKNNIDFGSDYTSCEFNCAVHMMYYDYHQDLKEFGVTSENLLAAMADSYLTDEDAPKGKLVNHFFFMINN